MNPETEHPAVHENICGFIIKSPNIEWICVREDHRPVYTRKNPRGMRAEFDDSGQHPERENPMVRRAPWEAHHMVNRWPWRPIFKE